MKFVLFYENIQREVQNAYLLKAELKRRGHELYICDMFYMLNISREKIGFIPDAVLTPYLYEDHQLEYFKLLFDHKIRRIVNLQYEQILTNRHNQLGFHIPKNLNRNAIHLCWGEKWKNIMINGGVPEKNCIITGSLNVDMDRERFDGLYKTRSEIAVEHNLDENKKWILFISSFNMVNLSKDRKQYNYNRLGKKQINERIEIDTKSRNMILEWIEKYISENNNCEFIYRPHPGENLEDDIIYNMLRKYTRFHIIRDDSVRAWIKVCDKINTWATTSIVDVYFMKKNCSILRPIPIASWMNNGLTDKGDFISDYESFKSFNENDSINKFPIDESLILENFYIDEEKYAYELICDLLENIVNKDIKMDFYNDEECDNNE